ncbi:hypothetical protein [Spongiivirga citrea]|uniref:Nuclear transport factor 2 family protein n=1 Tax=Spongiivirga citrea TaxID=1481457 RepID=A0A6M0CHQ8_9FLAO|nr:hypothetical protein [Spongiivirga citrea]NER17496.1 hypothetical protein [Spongiivirga citrea]
MKNTILIVLFTFGIAFHASSQSLDEKYGENVNSLGNTLETLYGVISGPKGEKRNWELFNYLFLEDAKLIPSGQNRQGANAPRYLSTEDYIKLSGKWLEENGFFEKELHRKTEIFGSLVHVWSTYESFKNATDKEPFARGINSIQLYFDGSRYWVTNIYWTGERPDLPIPGEYLPKN